MNISINLSEARKRLPELVDRANSGDIYTFSRRGRELAVLIGLDEYKRLVAIEGGQRTEDFDALLAPPPQNALSEEAASELAVQIVREHRALYTTPEE